MLRIVLDTNVLVSTTIRNGKPRRLLQAGINGKYNILSSYGILDEFSDQLSRELSGFFEAKDFLLT